MTPEEEEKARLERARTAGGYLAPKPPPPAAPPASAPFGFTKAWTPEERRRQAAAQVKKLREMGER
jgi:hypothetical protein